MEQTNNVVIETTQENAEVSKPLTRHEKMAQAAEQVGIKLVNIDEYFENLEKEKAEKAIKRYPVKNDLGPRISFDKVERIVDVKNRTINVNKNAYQYVTSLVYFNWKIKVKPSIWKDSKTFILIERDFKKETK